MISEPFLHTIHTCIDIGQHRHLSTLTGKYYLIHLQPMTNIIIAASEGANSGNPFPTVFRAAEEHGCFLRGSDSDGQ